LLEAVDGTHPHPEKRWNTLNEAKQDESWLDEFRMHKETHDELYHLCEPQVLQHRALNPAYRVHSKRHKLLMTLNWLAQVHASRQLRNRFNVPYNMFTARILRLTISALQKVLVQDEHTKTIVWPSSPAELQAVADGI
jgi:hypothetical protein